MLSAVSSLTIVAQEAGQACWVVPEVQTTMEAVVFEDSPLAQYLEGSSTSLVTSDDMLAYNTYS